MIKVRDGNRTLQFEGALLAHSSSRTDHPDKMRWVEFFLYKAENNVYVISRVGVSHIYHNEGCKVIQRNHLDPDEVPQDYENDCEHCGFAPTTARLYPETERYWALHSPKADGIVKALYKPDRNGVPYLTKVARELLEQAAENDDDIDDAYYNEEI